MQNQVLISGASGNLGKDVVKKLTDLDFGLHMNIRNPRSGAYLEQANVFTYKADLSDPSESEQFVTNAISKAGSIQAGVLLAGGFAMGEIADTTSAEIDKMVTLNFMTAFNLVKPLIAHFEANGGGQFVFIGARPALEAEQGFGSFAYTLSKSLIFQMADMINSAHKDKNITASVIVPSIIDTPDNRAAMPNEDFNKWVSGSDIAEAIAFILSDTGRRLRQTVLKVYNEA